MRVSPVLPRQAEFDAVPVEPRQPVQRPGLHRRQPLGAHRLHEIGDRRLGEQGHMAEHVVEDVGLLDIIEAVGGADEIAGREAALAQDARRRHRPAPGRGPRPPSSRSARTAARSARRSPECRASTGAARRARGRSRRPPCPSAPRDWRANSRSQTRCSSGVNRSQCLRDGPIGASRRSMMVSVSMGFSTKKNPARRSGRGAISEIWLVKRASDRSRPGGPIIIGRGDHAAHCFARRFSGPTCQEPERGRCARQRSSIAR